MKLLWMVWSRTPAFFWQKSMVGGIGTSFAQCSNTPAWRAHISWKTLYLQSKINNNSYSIIVNTFFFEISYFTNRRLPSNSGHIPFSVGHKWPFKIGTKYCQLVDMDKNALAQVWTEIPNYIAKIIYACFLLYNPNLSWWIKYSSVDYWLLTVYASTVSIVHACM